MANEIKSIKIGSTEYPIYPDKAINATNDSDGNAINTTYLKKSGGTMTGPITMNVGTGIQMKYDRATDGNPWMYANGADAYGIRYFEGDPDKMVLSA